MRCATCGQEHDWSALEPSFARPDAYWAIPEAERRHRTLAGQSDCRIRDAADTERQYFLRVMVSIPIRGESDVCKWGLWVEVSERDFQRAWELWDEPDQSHEPSFPGTLANRITQYPPTLGLPGQVQLTGPNTPPEFTFDGGVDHPFATEQREGVQRERQLQWLSQRAHS